MFNKPSWNNKREGFLRPPDEEQEERKKNLLERMRETIASKKQEAEEKKPTLEEISKQDHFDLDASIAQEAQKRVVLTQPKLKGKFNPIVIPVPIEVQEENEETTVENQEVVEVSPCKKEVFSHPDPANTDITDLIYALDTVKNYLLNAKQEVLFLGDNIHQTDFETSDFLHSIELSQFSPEEKEEVFDKMREIRQRRRSYKERLEYVKELEQFVDKNVNIANKLASLQGQLEHIRDKQNSAMYFTKVRNDIKEDDTVHIGYKVVRNIG